ncbi:hypothetical protein ACH0B6_17105 [Solibacillus silvestris]
MLKNIAKRLKSQHKEDKKFQLEYDALQKTHLSRIKIYFKEEEQPILEEISLVFNRQYAQGMLIVETFKLSNENIELIDEPVSYIDVMNTYPTHLFNLFKESNQDIYYVDTAHALAMELLAAKGTRVFEIFKASCADITNVAIANTLSDMYSTLVTKELMESFKDTDRPMIFNAQYFVSPFIQKDSIGSNLMQYDMFTYNTPQKAMSWVGRIMCHPFNPEVNTMDVFLSDSIDSNEKQVLLTQFGSQLQSEQPIQMNLYNISSVTTFTYLQEQTKEAPLS